MPGGHVLAVERLRPQPVDEVAQLADRDLQRIDRGVHAALGFGRGRGHDLGHVFERQRDRVQRLDDAVVQVAADPVALADDREVGGLLVEAGVVDGDAGVQREQLDQALVVRA